MAGFEEVQEKKNTDSIKSLDEALLNIEQRQEEAAEPPVRESQSQNFFVRFVNFITGRSRKRPGRAGTMRNAEVAETTAQQQAEAVSEEVAGGQQASQEATQIVDSAVRDELIQNKKDYLNRRFIEFVDAQPIVKVLVKRNIMSLTLCRSRFTRYLGELAEKAVDIDLRHSIDALEGEALEAAQDARIRERVNILGGESEDKVINSLLYDNNGDGFIPLVFPQGIRAEIIGRIFDFSKLRPDTPEAKAFIENFRHHWVYEDNYTDEMFNEDFAIKAGTVLLTRISFRQEEMINDVMSDISGLEGGELVRTLDNTLGEYTVDMLGKTILNLPPVFEQFIKLAKIPLPTVEQIDDELKEVEEMNSIRAQNEAMGTDPYDYKDSHTVVSLPGRLAEQDVRDMFRVVIGRAELVEEFVTVFKRSAGIEGFSVDKKLPLATVADIVPFIYEAGGFAMSNVIIRDTYINIMQSNSRRECEGFMIQMFDNISRLLPKEMQKIAFRKALIS